MPKERPTVFISHISDETELALLLKRRIEKDFLHLVKVFVSSDGISIGAGDEWLRSIVVAIKKASVEVVLCSNLSIKRPWINFEAGAGWLRGVKVIPVCHSGLKPSELPMPLSALQGIEISQASGIERLYSQLTEEVGISPPIRRLAQFSRSVIDFEKRYSQQMLNTATGALLIPEERLERDSKWYGKWTCRWFPASPNDLSWETETVKIEQIGEKLHVVLVPKNEYHWELWMILRDGYFVGTWRSLRPHARSHGTIQLSSNNQGDVLFGLLIGPHIDEKLSVFRIVIAKNGQRLDEYCRRFSNDGYEKVL